MTNTKRKKFTQEQKDEAVRLSSEPGRSVRQVAEELGVGYSSLTKWRTERGVNHKKWETLSAEQAQIKKLQKENVRLEAENSFLKKTATFFASQKL